MMESSPKWATKSVRPKNASPTAPDASSPMKSAKLPGSPGRGHP